MCARTLAWESQEQNCSSATIVSHRTWSQRDDRSWHLKSSENLEQEMLHLEVRRRHHNNSHQHSRRGRANPFPQILRISSTRSTWCEYLSLTHTHTHTTQTQIQMNGKNHTLMEMIRTLKSDDVTIRAIFFGFFGVIFEFCYLPSSNGSLFSS